MRLLHLKIFIGIWIVIILVSFWVPKELITTNLFSPRVMNLATFLWICGCFVAFWMGTFIERSLYAGNHKLVDTTTKIPQVNADKLERMLKTLKGLLILVTGIILFRFVWSVIKVGSLQDLLYVAITKPIHFRFDIWQQTTIHGLGAFSDVIIGCTIFAFAFFALMKKYRANIVQTHSLGVNSKKIQRYSRDSTKLLTIAIFVLIIYFFLDSERLVLVMGLLGGFLVYYLILRRFPLKNLIYIFVFFLFIWVFVEGTRRHQFHGSGTIEIIFNYAMDRLMLYLVPAVRNVDTVINYIDSHTYGWYTFSFIPTTLNMDSLPSVVERIYAFSAFHVVPGFGAIPVFGVAYADFGAAGLLYFVVIGFIYQRLHRNAILKNNFLALQLYALFLVALIISFMPFLLTLARFWVVVLALLAINKSVNLSLRDRRLTAVSV